MVRQSYVEWATVGRGPMEISTNRTGEATAGAGRSASPSAPFAGDRRQVVNYSLVVAMCRGIRPACGQIDPAAFIATQGKTLAPARRIARQLRIHGCFPLTVEDGAPFHPPAFGDYPATDDFRGRPAPVDRASHPLASRFRTRLREGTERGPNFAGHYTIASWGVVLAA
jgi:hypothetical protein